MGSKDRKMSGLENQSGIPLFIIAGWSGSGKTCFLERLIPEFKKRGLRVGTVKHHHSGLELDKPGKDSWRHKNAGSEITVISSPEKIGVVMDVDHDPLIEELTHFFSGMDLVVVEGYKDAKRPKVEIFRSAVHETPKFLNDPNLIAIVSDVSVNANVPVFDLNDPGALADFVISRFIST